MPDLSEVLSQSIPSPAHDETRRVSAKRPASHYTLFRQKTVCNGNCLISHGVNGVNGVEVQPLTPLTPCEINPFFRIRYYRSKTVEVAKSAGCLSRVGGYGLWGVHAQSKSKLRYKISRSKLHNRLHNPTRTERMYRVRKGS